MAEKTDKYECKRCGWWGNHPVDSECPKCLGTVSTIVDMPDEADAEPVEVYDAEPIEADAEFSDK
jgi:hypothetical protein